MFLDDKNEKAAVCSVSCDTSDLKSSLEEDWRSTNVIDVKNDTSTKNITKYYQRKSKEHPFGTKLSDIREEMREFCDNMDRFVDENRIVFENGQVEGFWGEQTTEKNLQRDVEDREIRETGIEISTNEEDKLRWWNSKERKLKIKEIIKKQEDKRNEGHFSSQDKQTADTANNFQNVYDLMTLKTCPKVLPDSKGTYHTKDYEGKQSTEIQGEKSRGVFDSLFAELRHRDSRQTRKPNVSNELMILEEIPYSENSAIDTEEKSVSALIDTTMETNLVDSDGRSSNRESIIDDKSYAKIEILEDKFCDLSFESSEAKKNVDESDDDSFKTATSFLSIQDDSQILESIQESLEIPRLSDENNSEIIDLAKNETIDESINKDHKDAIYENEENDKTGRFSDKMESLRKEQKLLTEIEKPDSKVESLVDTMKHLSLDKTNQSSRFRGKRIREAEDIEISNKRSFLDEKMNVRKSEGGMRKSRNQISERCRQHLIQEAKKFTKKVSPLIDRCITTLIKDAENVSEKSRRHKYDRINLAEDLTSDFVSKIDLDKTAGVSKEGNNFRGKCQSELNDVGINEYSETRESMAKQTFNSKPVALSNDTGKKRVNINIYVCIK